ncbi:universal stress protein [Ramlibacter sp.]|uniref:universal stress protein n=1 Tax=Ramlibacter sp. TaxID=1917967 RepID=UPI0035AE7B50
MYQRILVPFDGSDTSCRALDAAVRMARESGGTLRVVHVMEDSAYMTGYDPMGGSSGLLLKAVREGARRILADGVERAGQAGLVAEAELLDPPGGRLGSVVAEAARKWQADLVVVGTYGRRGLGRVLLGSGAEQVIREATVPVLVIRAAAEA